ncbi:unnamed protein product [Urochloa humidicola]
MSTRSRASSTTPTWPTRWTPTTRTKVEEAVREANDWLDGSVNTAEEEDYEEKLKELEDVCSPVISAVYQRSGREDSSNNDEDDHDEL